MQAQFYGATYQPELDFARLNSLLNRVRNFMADGQWHTLKAIAEACGGSEASVSARLRDLRKEGRIVERQRIGDPKAGVFAYRVVPK